MDNYNRPLLLFVCHPLTGHITPVLRVASGLRDRGWPVAFLSSNAFQARIMAAGLQYVPLTGVAARLDDGTLFDRDMTTGKPLPDSACLPGLFEGKTDGPVHPLPASITDSRYQALLALPAQWESLRMALDALAETHARILLVSEAFFFASMVLRLAYSSSPSPMDQLSPRARAALVPRSVCISITAPAIHSVDLPPFGQSFPITEAGHCLVPGDMSPGARRRLASQWAHDWTTCVEQLTACLRAQLQLAGIAAHAIPRALVWLDGSLYVCHDAIAQVGVPGFELPRSDMPPQLRIVGIVPPLPLATDTPDNAPTWWPELVHNATQPIKTRRRVVVVAQGTVETDPTALILPTAQALVDRADDVLVVAILGVRTATPTEDLAASAMASGRGVLSHGLRVAGFLSYDAVLPYADLWVHNGGYGAVMHGIAHGVPMVVAGTTQDKPENGRRVQWSGVGIDLETTRPGVATLRAALDAVLADGGYAARARALQAEARSLDLYANVEAMVLEQLERAGEMV